MSYNPATGGISAAEAITAVEDEVTLDLDGGRVGIGGVADGAEKLKVSGNIVVTGTVDGVDVATRDHARYADAEAVAAVEAADVDFAGTVTFAEAQIIHRVTVNNAASPYTVLATDHYIGVTTAGGAVELDMPTGAAGRVIVVKDEGGNAGAASITVDPNLTEQIDAGGAGTPFVMNAAREAYTFVGIGGGWAVT